MVEIWLPYGDTEVCVRVPASNMLDVIEPKKVSGTQNPQKEIRNALKKPLAAPCIADLAKPGAKVTIVLKDSGASTNHMILSALIEELKSSNIREEDVTVLVAYDPFKAPSSKHGSTMLSMEVFKIIRHSCLNHGTYVGKTSRGTEIFLNRVFMEADVKILAGPVEPHPVAGYSGGRELIVPGIARIDSINKVFKLGLDEKAVIGNLNDNPVHEEMIEAASLADIDFAVSIVRNDAFDVVKVFAGDFNKAFEEAVRFAEEIYKVPVENRADVVFISPGGSAFDSTLQEATTCLHGALKISKRKKNIVLVAECSSGCGDKEFIETASKFANLKDLRRDLKKKFSIPKFMAYRLLSVLQESNVLIVSAMPNYYVSRVFRMKIARTVNEAFRLFLDAVGSRGKFSFIPKGCLTIPFMKT